MSKLKLVKVNEDGTEEVLKEDIRNIIYVAEMGESEDNILDFGFTTNELRTEKIALMKFIFERQTAKMLNDSHKIVGDYDGLAAEVERLFDML